MTNEEAILILNTTVWLGTHEDLKKREQAVRIAIEALKTQQWILVNERLPESQTNVLVSVHDTTGDIAFDYSSYGWITTDKECWIVDNEICNYVVAWMPLPEPYEER